SGDYKCTHGFQFCSTFSTLILISISLTSLKLFLKISLIPKLWNEVFTCKLWLGRGFSFWIWRWDTMKRVVHNFGFHEILSLMLFTKDSQVLVCQIQVLTLYNTLICRFLISFMGRITYGGRNKFRLGIQVQRCFIIITLCCLPCWAVHLVIEQILLATNQPPLIANCILVYVIASRIYRHTWNGLHVEMWHDWGVWFRLGVPGVVMFGLEWWICEAGNLTAGLRGEEALVVQTILNNVESVIFCTFPIGYGIAVAIRVGQFVGSNNSVGPKSTAFVGILTLVFVAIMNTVVLLLGRYRIPRIFTAEVKLIEATAYGMPSVVAYQFFDCIVGVCSGVIRGVGMQKFGAIVCCVSMYLIGGPLALCLLLLTDLVVPGFWWGLTIGMAIEVILYIIKCCRIDWAEKLTEIKFVSSNLRRETFRMAEYAKGKSEDHSEAAADVGGCGEDEEFVKVCTPLILMIRFLIIFTFSVLLLIAICCRYCVDWSSYFQSHCLLSNGTLLPLHSRSATRELGCVRLIP
ncbi:Multidrug and toxin extrusion protein 1, partial [Taenia solium]